MEDRRSSMETRSSRRSWRRTRRRAATTTFGRPFHTTAVDPANADACDALYGAVRTQVELQVEYLLQRRGDDPYDDFVKRLAYEVGGSTPTLYALCDRQFLKTAM